MKRVTKILHVNSLSAGLSSGKPFYIEDIGLYVSTDDFKSACKGVSAFGYDLNGNEADIQADDAFIQYLLRSLKVNIVDAPISFKRKDHWIFDHPTCLVLTLAGRFTPQHIDPIEDGGGWMYLEQGRKFWMFETEQEFISAEIKSGGFIYFPPGVAHQVYTHEDSLGIGGYIK